MSISGRAKPPIATKAKGRRGRDDALDHSDLENTPESSQVQTFDPGPPG